MERRYGSAGIEARQTSKGKEVPWICTGCSKNDPGNTGPQGRDGKGRRRGKGGGGLYNGYLRRRGRQRRWRPPEVTVRHPIAIRQEVLEGGAARVGLSFFRRAEMNQFAGRRRELRC
jgi:hypothetical protein